MRIIRDTHAVLESGDKVEIGRDAWLSLVVIISRRC